MVEEVLFIAPILGCGGYVSHALGILKGIYKKVDIKCVPLPYSGVTKRDKEMSDILNQTINNKVSEFAPVIWLTLPSNVKYIPNRFNINITTFEADKICSEWVMVGKAMDLTIVTCNFLKEVWNNCGVEKVEVLEEGVDLNTFNDKIRPLPLMYKGKLISDVFEHRILICAELSNRKNVRNAVLSFKNAFSGRKDVCLILKASYMEQYKNIEYWLGDIDLSDVYVFLIDQFLPDEAIPSLFQVATCYFNLSCGEGWDLNCVQMGAMKKPVIVPYHTAYSHYLNDDRAFLIKKYKKIPAIQDNILDRFFKGSNWFLPDIDEAVDILKYYIKSSSTEKENKINNFYNYIRDYLTWDKIGDKLIEILNNRF